MSLKQKLLQALPPSLQRAWGRFRAKETRYQALSTEEVFSKIYATNAWGTPSSPGTRFFSGTGSHDPAVVDEYVDCVSKAMADIGGPLDAVDLGCGDFAVGAQIRHCFRRYVACDVVAALIEFNRKRFQDLDVEFQHLDLSEDELPPGDVVLVRQVLQHLSNHQVSKALAKFRERYRFLVLTEHLPGTLQFVPNIDKPMGANVRINLDSGLVITEPPFSLPVLEQRILLEVPESGGKIVTTLYTLR
jgi:hypothetical protein